MAEKDNEDDLVVNIDDPDTITVDVDDNPELAVKPEPKVKEVKVKETKTVKRVQPDVEVQGVVTTTPEEALEQAKTFAKQQEDARRAAEATAANERAMREQAQREAAQARTEADQSRTRAENSELAIIENGIASAEREVTAYEAEYTRAAEAGEFAKMATIQTKLSKAAAALDRLENAKATFDVKQTQTTEGRVEAPVVQPSVVERYLSQFTPVAQSWLRQHLDCAPAEVGGDVVKNSKMMQGHYAALAQNIQLNTPEYFKVIEEHINPPAVTKTVESKAAEIQIADTKPAPKHVQPSAPVSRDAPASGAPRNVREVRLTKDQQEMARVSFPHLPEAQAYGQYARNLIELEAEGKIGRSTH